VIDGAATLRRDLLKPRLRPSSPQARAYNPRMNPSANLILVGPMGAGKTCIGQRLAALCGLRLLDADHEIERDSGATVTEIFEREGEAGFRARESAMLARLLDADGVVLATGGGAVLDANNRALLRGFVVYLQASVEQQLRRLAHDRTRPLLARPDREQVLHQLAVIRSPLYAEAADLEFDSADLDADSAAMQLATLLAQRWLRIGAAA
jgi:shikimate kinase